MKLCKDCKHFEHSPRASIVVGQYQCLRKGLSEPDPVTGRRSQSRLDAFAERAAGWIETRLIGFCGKEGRFFEPAERNQCSDN